MIFRPLIFTSAIAIASIILPAFADSPAVSGLNGKLGVLGGEVEGDGSVVLIGSITAPLGHSFGFQADGLLGRVGDDDAQGLGAHLFWRDPGVGMVGITASRNWLEDVHADRVGIEGELYLDDLTLSASGGRQSGDVRHENYSALGVSYYLNDDLRLEASAVSVGDDQMFGLGTEWQFRDNASAYLRGTTGDNNHSIAVGVQMTFGGTSGGSLKTRHRFDDPVNPLFNNLVNTLGEFRSATMQCNEEYRSVDCYVVSPSSSDYGLCLAQYSDFEDYRGNPSVNYNFSVSCDEVFGGGVVIFE